MDLRTFRLCAGELDNEVKETFVALGGSSDLSGEIPTAEVIRNLSAVPFLTTQHVHAFASKFKASSLSISDLALLLHSAIKPEERTSPQGPPGIIIRAPVNAAMGCSPIVRADSIVECVS